MGVSLGLGIRGHDGGNTVRLDAWTLAVVGAGTGEQPWAEIHPTAAAALASVVNCFGEYLERYDDEALLDDARVADILDEVATFTIEPAIIDTDELAPSE